MIFKSLKYCSVEVNFHAGKVHMELGKRRLGFTVPGTVCDPGNMAGSRILTDPDMCNVLLHVSCLTLTLHSSHVHVARWSLFPTHRTAFISLRNIWNYDSIYKSLLLIKSPHSYFQSWWLTTFKYIFRFFSLNNPVLIRFNAIFIKCILFWGDLAYQTSN